MPDFPRRAPGQLLPALLVATGLLLAGACARIVAPSGGPEDLDPPSLLESRPASGSGLEELSRIELEWSERLDKASASVSLFPDPGFGLAVRGSRMVLTLDSPLPEAATLVLVVPGSLSDRRGNRIETPVSLVYSRADSVPAAALDLSLTLHGSGSVSEHCRVELYSEEQEAPLRVTSPDSLGRAIVPWLGEGELLVRSFEDRDFDLLWSPDQEAGAETLVVLGPSDTLRVDLSLSIVDTIGPGIVDAEALDGYHVRVDFTEQLSEESGSPGHFAIVDSSGASVAVLGVWLRAGRESSSAVVATQEALGERELLVRALDFSDLLGNATAADSIRVEGTTEMPGESLMVSSHFPASGQVDVSAAGPFYITFTDWVDPDSLRARWRLSSVADSADVAGTIEMMDARSFRFVPDHELLGQRQYRFDLLPGLVSAFADTMEQGEQWLFIPAWGVEPGAVSGTITGWTGGRDVTVQAAPAGSSGQPLYAVVKASLLPGFLLESVPAGRYTLCAFVDADADSSWGGSAEPYGVFPGVVEVF
ncbi:hypothetical protein JW921_03965, partial [Candidatus Fermentibacterales bacterium]|nr:hypothetical protein [Candidatus Fermentibacterales bacterium]